MTKWLSIKAPFIQIQKSTLASNYPSKKVLLPNFLNVMQDFHKACNFVSLN